MTMIQPSKTTWIICPFCKSSDVRLITYGSELSAGVYGLCNQCRSGPWVVKVTADGEQDFKIFQDIKIFGTVTDTLANYAHLKRMTWWQRFKAWING